MPEPTRAALAEFIQQAAADGVTAWPTWNRRLNHVRRLGAELLRADVDEVALIRNTTEGISLVAEGFPWQPGDNVVTLADEFPSNVYPWLNLKSRGVETRRLATDGGAISLQALRDACDERTRIVTLSWVNYATGYRHDLNAIAELVHQQGALLFVDAIQGLGVYPLDVRATPIDFLAADGHKWMLGPEGAGLFYVRREHLDRLRAIGVGWHSVVHSQDFQHIALDLKPAASRYEGGSQTMIGMTGFGASLELLLAYGADRIERRLLDYTDMACEQLQSIGAQVASHRDGTCRSGIVAFELPGQDPATIRERCLEAAVVVNVRGGRLRISPHAYNNEDDLDRLIAALAS
ncbi:MAG: aminotransferase class V-fold PLP-dependent enzyme [Planctomycetales bacterium]|nr:aminotransferase class V-fold PLP-dependent enzyme [Planctomycetales bacterium]